MTEVLIDDFWCCLPEPEKTAWAVCGLAYTAFPAFIERTVVDVLFVGVDTGVSLKRLALFVYEAGLEAGIIVIEEVEIEVYFYITPGIPTYAAFWLAGEFSCECRCKIQRFPEPC